MEKNVRDSTLRTGGFMTINDVSGVPNQFKTMLTCTESVLN